MTPATNTTLLVNTGPLEFDAIMEINRNKTNAGAEMMYEEPQG